MPSLQTVQNLPVRFAKAKGDSFSPKLEVIESTPPPQVLFKREARESGLSQTQYLATTLNVQRIQNALRAAERGDVWLFFTIVRDMTVSYTHLTTEWNKRKMVIVGQPMSLIPADPTSEDDKLACKVVQEAIDNCGNWQDGLQHLLDATLMPLSAAEKIWEPVPLSNRKFKYLKRLSLKQIAPISYTLLNFKVPYQPSLGGNINPALTFDPDNWEAWLRFYDTEPNGAISYSMQGIYEANPIKHIVHRGNLLSPTIPPNFGGHIRAVLFWWLLATQDRDWWALMMQKYGMPIPVGKVDVQNSQTVSTMQSALALGMQLGGIIIDKKAELEWGLPAGTDGSNAHKIFSDFCNSEVSKLVVGQVTSAKPEKGGLAGGMAEQSESVRDDVRMWDVIKLSDTLQRQLFRDILDFNGYSHCGTPRIFWGGMSAADLAAFSKSMASMYQAGVRLSPAGIVSASERAGISFEQIPQEVLNPVKPNTSAKDNLKSNGNTSSIA